MLLRAGSNSAPSFSPDGRGVVFSRVFFDKRSGEYLRAPGLWRVGVTAAGLRRLTHRTGFCPHWSPGGNSIAYGTSSGALRVVAASGRDDRPLLASDNWGNACDARWSPDSKSILLVRTKRRLVVLDVTTRKLRALVNRGVSSATWSPDRTQVLFASAVTASCSALETIAADGTGLRQLTRC